MDNRLLYQAIDLLRNLADLQNDAPLERHRKEWEETMRKVYDFLDKVENNPNHINVNTLDLNTLKQLYFKMGAYSDMTTKTQGYGYLTGLIKGMEKKF